MARRQAGEGGGVLARLADRVLAARDALVSSLAFQRNIARVPGVRKIAQKQAKDVFDLVAGFVYSQTLAACVDLGILTLLRDRPMTVGELALAARVPDEGMERLTAAAAAIGLLSRRSGGRFGLGLRGAAIAGNPGLLQMIAHHAMFYRDLADPVALLRAEKTGTELSRYWAYAGAGGGDLSEADVAAYSDLMGASQTLIADAVLDAYPFARHARMLDVGGGDGTFITRVAARHPNLTFLHFDLPAVSARALANFTHLGLAQRVSSIPGSFFDDELPQGADLVTLVRILHDHDDAGVKNILSRVRRAIAASGVLVIAEPLAGTRGAESMGDAYFGFYLMAMGKGRPRTFLQLAGMLNAAGFTAVTEIATDVPLQTRLITAKPDLKTVQ